MVSIHSFIPLSSYLSILHSSYPAGLSPFGPLLATLFLRRIMKKHLLLLALLSAALLLQDVTGSRVQMGQSKYWNDYRISSPNLKQDNPSRLLIGSVAPTCTYNECRGCRYKCRAEQVPVEGNDPINSAYHYKCVCHR